MIFSFSWGQLIYFSTISIHLKMLLERWEREWANKTVKNKNDLTILKIQNSWKKNYLNKKTKWRNFFRNDGWNSSNRWVLLVLDPSSHILLSNVKKYRKSPKMRYYSDITKILPEPPPPCPRSHSWCFAKGIRFVRRRWMIRHGKHCIFWWIVPHPRWVLCGLKLA